MNPRFEQMVRQIAAQQGRRPEEVMAEMLQSQMGQAPQQLPPSAPRTEVVPAHQGPQRFPMPSRFAGVPAPRDESEAEVIARYLEAESGPDGVFGDGGMTGGGIFGGEAVATQGHDPAAQQRTATQALMALGQSLAQQRQAPQQYPQQYPQAPYYPPPQQMPPPQPPQTVRMVERTVIYEGPAPQQQYGAPPQQLPPPWWPWR